MCVTSAGHTLYNFYFISTTTKTRSDANIKVNKTTTNLFNYNVKGIIDFSANVPTLFQ